MGLAKSRRISAGEAQGAPGHWLLPLAIVVVCGLLAAAGDHARLPLRYAREAVLAGDGWRLVSGHFVHLGPAHFAMNALALAAIWALVGAVLQRWQWLLVLVIVIAGIDAGFLWLDPGLTWYVGLSGVLHGLLAAGLVATWRAPPCDVIVLAILLVAKLAYEQLAGPLPGSAATAGGPVVVNAHLYGAAAGVLAGLVVSLAGHVKVRGSQPE